mmetsp:Transcript_30434/g.60812  ORF Transcript_30434/g.60812 Transcript_30434/m.60812 type:complete len:138 (-) Transcript_30434:489-902(-)
MNGRRDSIIILQKEKVHETSTFSQTRNQHNQHNQHNIIHCISNNDASTHQMAPALPPAITTPLLATASLIIPSKPNLLHLLIANDVFPPLTKMISAPSTHSCMYAVAGAVSTTSNEMTRQPRSTYQEVWASRLSGRS